MTSKPDRNVAMEVPTGDPSPRIADPRPMYAGIGMRNHVTRAVLAGLSATTLALTVTGVGIASTRAHRITPRLGRAQRAELLEDALEAAKAEQTPGTKTFDIQAVPTQGTRLRVLGFPEDLYTGFEETPASLTTRLYLVVMRGRFAPRRCSPPAEAATGGCEATRVLELTVSRSTGFVLGTARTNHYPNLDKLGVAVRLAGKNS